jgi:hypothetical protein
MDMRDTRHRMVQEMPTANRRNRRLGPACARLVAVRVRKVDLRRSQQGVVQEMPPTRQLTTRRSISTNPEWIRARVGRLVVGMNDLRS